MVTPAHRAPAAKRWRPATAAGITEAESRAWAAATAALDRVAAEAERTWGVGRLQELVAPDLAARFATAQEQCDMEIAGGDVQASAQKAAALARGWRALDAAARAAGHQPNDLGVVWTASIEGQAFAVCLHTADVGAMADRHPGHTAVALEELLRVLMAREAAIYRKAKEIWPGATISAARPASPTRPPANWKSGDELPF